MESPTPADVKSDLERRFEQAAIPIFAYDSSKYFDVDKNPQFVDLEDIKNKEVAVGLLKDLVNSGLQLIRHEVETSSARGVSLGEALKPHRDSPVDQVNTPDLSAKFERALDFLEGNRKNPDSFLDVMRRITTARILRAESNFSADLNELANANRSFIDILLNRQRMVWTHEAGRLGLIRQAQIDRINDVMSFAESLTRPEQTSQQ